MTATQAHRWLIAHIPWADRIAVAALGAMLTAVGTLLLADSDVPAAHVWVGWFLAAGLLCLAYAAKWTRSPALVRELSGAMASTAMFARGMALFADAVWAGSELPTHRLILSVIVWWTFALWLAWSWARLLPVTDPPSHRRAHGIK